MKRINRNHKIRNFHQAKWDEPIIFELSNKGERGILVPNSEEEIVEAVGDGVSKIPESMKRKSLPNLPEINQKRVLMHYLRLSQETLGADLNIEIGQGTCTMKYNPKINEYIACLPEMTELHPPRWLVQGILEIMYKTDLCMRNFRNGSIYISAREGSHAIFTMASTRGNILRKWREKTKRRNNNNSLFSSFRCCSPCYKKI